VKEVSRMGKGHKALDILVLIPLVFTHACGIPMLPLQPVVM
jgi:hypothetical protein